MAPLNTNVVPFTVMYYACCHSCWTYLRYRLRCMRREYNNRLDGPLQLPRFWRRCAHNVLPAHQTDVELTSHNLLSRMQYNAASGFNESCGLPLQSLHDGQTLRHTPVRLMVCIEAPRTAIEQVMAAQPVVQQLVGNGWLQLFNIDPESGALAQHRGGRWYCWEG